MSIYKIKRIKTTTWNCYRTRRTKDVIERTLIILNIFTFQLKPKTIIYSYDDKGNRIR